MRTFWNWLTGTGIIEEARRPYIEPEVLQGYERAFKDEVRQVIDRTHDPNLRGVLTDMLDCPIKDSRGGCRAFTDYIYSALVKHGIHHQYDIEEALHYAFQQMMMPTTIAGERRATVFGGFVEKPGETPGYNPLQVRFMKSLKWVISAIRGGRIPRLAHAVQRPPGTVSISQGRQQDGDPAGGISADEIAARPSDDDMGEMVGDIITLLRRKEPAYGFPLVSLFRAIMAGMSSHEQRRQYGDRKVRTARLVIIDTVEEYARATGNHRLLNLLQRLRDRPEEASEQMPPVKAPKPILSDQQRDYASIASVVARFDRPVTSADLGKFRRRWLEYPPRSPGSGHRNRLEEVLEAMVRDGVLRTTPTRNGAVAYLPGPQFQAFHR